MQREEAAQDGSTAGAFERERTRAGAPLRKALELELAATTTDYICDALAASRSDEAYMLAQDDLAADPEWAGDRLLIIERGMALVADGMPTEGPELEEHNALYQEYLNAWKAKALERLLGWALAAVVVLGTFLSGFLGWLFAGAALVPLQVAAA